MKSLENDWLELVRSFCLMRIELLEEVFNSVSIRMFGIFEKGWVERVYLYQRSHVDPVVSFEPGI